MLKEEALQAVEQFDKSEKRESSKRSRHKVDGHVNVAPSCCSCSKEEHFLKLSDWIRLSRERSSRVTKNSSIARS